MNFYSTNGFGVIIASMSGNQGGSLHQKYYLKNMEYIWL